MRFCLVFCFLVLPTFLFGQGGVYKSSEDFEEVSNPDSAAATSFLYRVEGERGSFRYYAVSMNSLLYSSKKTFQWPAEVASIKGKYGAAFFADHESIRNKRPIPEMLFNDKIVLVSSDSLFMVMDNSIVELRNVKSPGIAWIFGSGKSTYQRFDGAGNAVEKPLPTFYYTLNDSAQILLIRSKDRISKEWNPYVPSGQFKNMEVQCEQIPELKMPARLLPDPPGIAEIDSAGLRALDKQMVELRLWIKEDSLQIVRFLDSIDGLLGVPAPKAKFENEKNFNKRVTAFLEEKKKMRALVADWNRISQLLLPHRQKLKMFEDYRKQQETYLANEEFRRAQDFRGGLLNHHLWNRLYFSGSWTIGRNMPRSMANPSPTYLSGGGIRLDWQGQLFKKFTWDAYTAAGYSQWKYKESEKEWSKQVSSLIGADIGIPLGIAPAGNYQLDTTRGLVILASVGPVMGMRYTKLEKNSEGSKEWTKVVGGAVGLRLYFGALPVLMAFDYSYLQDGFGDLSLRFALPLYRWRKQ